MTRNCQHLASDTRASLLAAFEEDARTAFSFSWLKEANDDLLLNFSSEGQSLRRVIAADSSKRIVEAFDRTPHDAPQWEACK